MTSPNDSHSPVRVFISYAWEDDPYREWVAQLATKLRDDGVDARLDRWHMQPGQTIPEFMNSEVRLAEKVLVLCSPQYQQKVHTMEEGGPSTGSGWESMVLSNAMFSGGARVKAVTVLARGEWNNSAPSYMQGIPYEDLTQEDKSRKGYQSLLRKLTNTTEVAPPVRSHSVPIPKGAELRQWLYGLRKFIDRPEKTHKQIVDALTEERIRGFVCLARDMHQHIPADFTESLACRLAAIEAENLHAEIWNAFNTQQGHTYPLRIESLAEIDSSARLAQSLNTTLYQKNGARGKKKLEEFERLNDTQQRDRILEAIKSESPQVAFIEVTLPYQHGWRTWFGRSQATRIQQLCDWVDHWNKGWRPGSREWNMPAIAVVLVLGVAPQAFDVFARRQHDSRTSSILLLHQIEEQDFHNWIADASTMMQAIEQPAYSKAFLENKSELYDHLTKQGSNFPLYYKEFSDSCKLLISNKR